MKKLYFLLFAITIPNYFFCQNLTSKQYYAETPSVYVAPGYSQLEKYAEIASQKAIKQAEYCDEIEKFIVNFLPKVKIEFTALKLTEILSDVRKIRKEIAIDKSVELSKIANRLSLIYKNIETENKIILVENSFQKNDFQETINTLNELDDKFLMEVKDWKYEMLSYCYSNQKDLKNAFESCNKISNKNLSALLKASLKQELKDYYGSIQEYEIVLNNLSSV